MPENFWVVADDTDPDINYVGSSWFADIGSQDKQGNFGSAYRSTQHGTKSSASLSFPFSGTSVGVFGTTAIRNDSGVVDPQWECFVDNVSIGFVPQFAFAENMWSLCNKDTLPDGPHTLTVNTTIAKSQPFWLDWIRYHPSSNVSLYKKTVMVDHTNPTLVYPDGWGPYADVAHITTKQDSFFTYDFYGVSVTWYGYIPGELNGNATTGTYSVDGEPPKSFALNGHPSGGITMYNQKFFETTPYPVGKHRLSVGFKGNSNTTPLMLSYLMVQNGTAPGPTTSGSTPSPSPNGTVENANKGTTNVGAIVGGVIGGLIFILLAAILIVLLRRRRRKAENRQSGKVDLTEGSGASVVEPFHYLPVSPGNASSPSQSTTWGLPSASKAGSTSPPSHYPSLPSRPLGEGSESSSGRFIARPFGITQPDSQLISAKAREAGVTAAQLPPLSPQRHVVNGSQSHVGSDVSSVLGSSSPPQGPQPFLRHQDSGVRLANGQVEQPVLELPPEYTPS